MKNKPHADVCRSGDGRVASLLPGPAAWLLVAWIIISSLPGVARGESETAPATESGSASSEAAGLGEEQSVSVDAPVSDSSTWGGGDGSEQSSMAPKDRGSAALHIVFMTYEANEYAKANGISFMFAAPQAYIGATAEEIRSERTSVLGGENNRQSLYGFVGISMDRPVSPYAEMGIAAGGWIAEAMWREMVDVCAADAPDSTNCKSSPADVYYSVGVQTRPRHGAAYVRAYLKWYAIGLEDRTEWIPVGGLSIGWPL